MKRIILGLLVILVVLMAIQYKPVTVQARLMFLSIDVNPRVYALVTPSTLASNMSYVYQAQPFVEVPAKASIVLFNMEYAFQAQPFVRNVSGAAYDITNAPSSEGLGSVAASSTYYAGSAPANPVADGTCTFTLTNASANTVKISIHGHAWTGGVGWALGANVGENIVKMTVYKTGDAPADYKVLTTNDQTFIASMAASGTIKWDFKLETGTFTDGVLKSSTITLTGAAP